MSRPKRNKALKSRLIRPDDLSPRIAEGLTQGATATEALNEHPVQKVAQPSAHVLRDADKRLVRGQPYAAFVVEDSFDAVWTDGVTSRKQRDVHKTYTVSGLRLLREGRQCLRCDEPHDQPFPVACNVCGYSMKERQVMDIAMEFEGEKHLGPSRPISEHLTELEMRTERRKFIDRVVEGGQGKIPKDWLRDATLFPSGTPKQLA